MYKNITAIQPPGSRQESAAADGDQLKSERGRLESARRLLGLLREKKALLATLALAGLASSLAVLYVPAILGQAIDQLGGAGQLNVTQFMWTILWAGLCYGGGALLLWLMQAFSQTCGGELCRELRRAGFDKLSRLPLKTLDRQPRGDLISRLSADLEAVGDGLVQLLNQLFSGLPILAGSLLLLFSLNLWTSLLVLAVTPLCFWVSSFIARRSYDYFMTQAVDLAALNSQLEEGIANQSLLQAFNAEEEMERRFSALNQALYRSGQKSQFFSSLSNPATRFVNHIAYGLVAGLSAWLVIRGELSVGQMTAILAYTLQFAKPINEISAVFTQLQNAFASAARVFDLLDAEEESPDAGLPDLLLHEGEVRFEKLSFSYLAEQKLIEQLDLHVPADALIAIVGPTGAGKTTLVNLLMRFYEPESGKILVDGRDIASCTRASLRRHIGMVLQDSWVFSGSVHQNIAYAKPQASREEVEEAARLAMLHGFIRRLPQGYDTLLEDGGEVLSQGQKQLLTIARTILLAPELLILDEATSAIDTRTEQLVQKAFLRLMRGRTSFIIAHRLSTIRDATHILVMDKGKIIEQGSHEELLAARGFYAELYWSQYRQLRA